jgi:hypothetical protein
MSSTTREITVVAVKASVFAAGHTCEHAMVQCGVPKKFAVGATFTFEIVNNGLTETVSAFTRKGASGLSPIEEAAVITGIEAALTSGALKTTALLGGSGVLLPIAVGALVILLVALNEEAILNFVGNLDTHGFLERNYFDRNPGTIPTMMTDYFDSLHYG